MPPMRKYGELPHPVALTQAGGLTRVQVQHAERDVGGAARHAGAPQAAIVRHYRCLNSLQRRHHCWFLHIGTRATMGEAARD